MTPDDRNNESTDSELPAGELHADEPISQVGSDDSKKSIPVWFLALVGLLLALIVLSMFTDGDDKDAQAGVTFTEEEYEVKGRPTPPMPREAAPRPTNPPPPPPPAAVVDLSNQLTPEQRQEARRAKELAAKRQRAPLVLVNKRGAQTADSDPLRQEASRRMAELQQSTESALLSLQGGNSSNQDSPATIRTADVENVEAGYVSDRSFKLLQGKIIPAVLETAINSDLPGMLRANVSESVYSEDGNFLLIPKGSRLIGEYSSGTQRGQSRVFVIWSRLLRPDGIDIKLDSPGTDTLGRSGLTGFVDTHFMERFGSSFLLSLIGSYAQQESENENQREALADSFNRSSEIALEDSINIAPTIHVNQGERINVFVAKDLNFKRAIEFAQRRNKPSYGQ